MNNEFIYSIDGNLKKNIIENFGEIKIEGFRMKVPNLIIPGVESTDIYKNESTYISKSKTELKDFLESYKNYNIDSVKNQLIEDVKNEFDTSVNDKLNNILTNADYSDAKKIVELEKLKNELIEEEKLEYRLYIDASKPIRDFLSIEGFRIKGIKTITKGNDDELKKKQFIEGIIKYYKTYKKETVTIDLNSERDEYVKQINKLIIDFNSPINCEYSYGECNSKCKRHINITKQPLRGGNSCPSSTIDCNPGEGECPYNPIDCNEKYGSCKLIDGVCKKESIIYEQEKHGGKPCKLPKFENCNDGEGSCPSDCIGIFSYCASDCTKKYKITRNAKNGGKECDYNDNQIVDCKGDNCIESVDCIGSWSNCDSNCEKTWNITTQKQGNGISCRFRDGTKIKCTEDDDSKCKEVINKNCQGRWTTCDSNCKKEWIIEDKASGSGTCDYSENTKYDCNDGEGNCLISKDCIGRWITCDENCKSKWELLEKEQGKNGRCDLIDGQEKSCLHGEGLCVIKDDNTDSSSNENDISKNESNDDNLKIIILVSFLIILGLIAY